MGQDIEKVLVMAPGGPSNLKQKRFVSRQSLFKGALTNARVTGLQDETLQKGRPNTLPSKHNPSCPQNPIIPLTRSANNFSDLASEASEPVRETSPIPSTERVPHASNKDAAAATAPVSKKKTRGETTGKGLLKYFDAFGKFKIEVDPTVGRPTNAVQPSKLATNIGIVTRKVLPIPIRWKEVDQEIGLKPGFDHLQMHMDLNVDKAGVKRSLVDRVTESSRQQRYKLHLHFLKYPDLQEAKDHKPKACPNQDNWEKLCDYFASPEFKRLSEINKSNRDKMLCKHTAGRKPFSVRSHELSLELKEPCDRIYLYEKTHSTKNNEWISDKAKENWETMKRKRDEYVELGIERTEPEIVLEVLGHGDGYTKEYGYGSKPPSRRSSLYNSSAEYEDELRETIEELQHSRAQVEELQAQVTSLKDDLATQNDNLTAKLSEQNEILTAKLSEQNAAMNKVMAFMRDKGIDI